MRKRWYYRKIYYVCLATITFWWLTTIASLKKDPRNVQKAALSRKTSPIPITITQEGFGILEEMFNGVIAGVNPLCRMLRSSRINHSRDSQINYSLTFSCREAFEKGVAGTGNLILTILYIHLTAKAFAPIQVTIQCKDAEMEKENLILPWLMGTTFYNQPTEGDETCRKRAHEMSVPDLLPELRRKLSRMVLSLTGDQTMIAPVDRGRVTETIDQVSISKTPSLFQFELDDAAIHFRCGDILVDPQ